MAAVSYCWFLTGSQGLYGPETLQQVERQSQQIVDQLNESGQLPLPVQWQPVLTDSEAIHRVMLEANADSNCLGVIAWMHTFSPAKMWITGLNALQTPLLHLHTQANAALPWAEIDMDFMNLNQAAHGDREFGYIQTRLGVARKTVVGHVSDPVGGCPHRRLAAGRPRLRRSPAAEAGPLRRQHARRRRHRGRQGRCRASVRGLGQHLWRKRSCRRGRFGHRRRGRRADRRVSATCTTSTTELARGGDRHESLRYGARIEAGLRTFLTDGGFGAFTTNFEDLGGLRQLPGLAVQRLMAEGYGFGGEGDWKTSVMLHTLKAMAAGQPGGTSFMEDYTYHLGPGTPKILGAHMLEVCPTIAADRPRIEIHPLSIGNREDPVRLVFDAATGPAVILGICDLGDRFRLVSNVVDVVEPDEPLPRLPGRSRGLGTPPQPGHRSRMLARGRRPAPHRALHRPRCRGTVRLRDDGRHRTARDRREHHTPRVRQRNALEPGVPPPRPGLLMSVLTR